MGVGKPILYCGDCGRSLREEDFDRRKAGYVQNAPFCLSCRPDAVPPERPAPPPSSSKHRALPTSTPSRSLPASKPNTMTGAVAAAVGGAVILLGLVAAFSSSSKPPAAPPPAPRPAPAPVAVRAPDPEPPRPRPAPPRPAEPEIPPAPENPALVLERYLSDIRSIRQNDGGFKRADEVRAMLRRAVELAGPRKAEVEALLAGYEKEVAAAQAVKPAPPPPTIPDRPLGEVVSFTLIDADTDKPVPGYDPIAPEASIDLGKLGLKKIDFRINTSPKEIGSIETVIDKEKPHTESAFPYSFTTNTVAKGYDGWTPAPGRHTLKCRLWSQEAKKGTAGPWVTFTFTVVDPR
jgi:hypothetical protein